jgi:UDP-N-acetylglucosamine 4-epimerase
VVDTIREIFPEMPEPQYGPARVGEVPHSRADIARAREKLGYEPSVSFKEALRELALGER